MSRKNRRTHISGSGGGRREGEGGLTKTWVRKMCEIFVMLTCSQCRRVFLQSSNLAHLGFPTTLSHLRRRCTTIELSWHCERLKRKTNLPSTQAASALGGWTWTVPLCPPPQQWPLPSQASLPPLSSFSVHVNARSDVTVTVHQLHKKVARVTGQ